MKSFLGGLLTIIIIGIAGYFAFQAINKFVVTKIAPSATPSPSSEPLMSPAGAPMGGTVEPSPTPSHPAQTYNPVTGKKPAITTDTSTTTTITSTHIFLTLIKTNKCPASYTSEVRDIKGPLTLKYSLKDGYNATITVWKQDNQEVISKRAISKSGEFAQINDATYLKVKVESTSCNPTSDNWLTVTAER